MADWHVVWAAGCAGGAGDCCPAGEALQSAGGGQQTRAGRQTDVAPAAAGVAWRGEGLLAHHVIISSSCGPRPAVVAELESPRMAAVAVTSRLHKQRQQLQLLTINTLPVPVLGACG